MFWKQYAKSLAVFTVAIGVIALVIAGYNYILRTFGDVWFLVAMGVPGVLVAVAIKTSDDIGGHGNDGGVR